MPLYDCPLPPPKRARVTPAAGVPVEKCLISGLIKRDRGYMPQFFPCPPNSEGRGAVCPEIRGERFIKENEKVGANVSTSR